MEKISAADLRNPDQKSTQISRSTFKTNTAYQAKQEAMIYGMIERFRMIAGWSALSKDEAASMIPEWAKYLNSYAIPLQAYPELERLALQARAKAIEEGKEAPLMNAELLIACWRGGLRSHYSKKEKAKPWPFSLADERYSSCPKCWGRGFYKIAKQMVAPLPGEYSIIEECDHAGAMKQPGEAPAADFRCDGCGNTGFIQAKEDDYQGVKNCPSCRASA